MPPSRGRSHTTPLALHLLLVIGLLVIVRLLFLGQPAGRDEAGFLLVGAGWDHGTSLYGAFWVDRPPLLIWIMELAGSLSTLRLWGLGASVLMVLGVARTAHLAAGDRAARWAASAAALFSAASWFGVVRTNGEMLASAFVAWGFAFTAQALLRPGNRPWLWASWGGVLGACALLVKQTVADTLVFALVLGMAVGWQQPKKRPAMVRAMAAGAAGTLAALGVGLAAAATRGTYPVDLFDALVTFRAAAGEVIRASASSATTDRLLVLLATWAVGGLAVIAVLTTWHTLRRREPVLIATWSVLVVVSAAALLGGSYWAHYLLQLVPASALAVGLLADHVAPRLRGTLTGLVIVATTCNLLWTFVSPPDDGVQAQVVGRWLKASAVPDDTVVVAYGQPNVLAAARMTSPYPYLWSLPVRTLDPDLTTMSSVLDGDSRPTWFVDWSGIDSWGINPAALHAVLDRRYREVADVCGRTVWLERSRPRSLAVPGTCP